MTNGYLSDYESDYFAFLSKLLMPTLFSSRGEAPLLMSSLTTSVWPPSVATWSGVLSVMRFLEVVTMLLSNLSSSSSTRTLPFLAAMWAEVFPS